MVYFLTFRIDDKNGMSACFTPRDALERHNDLTQKGATNVSISQDGEMLSLSEVEDQVTPDRRCARPSLMAKVVATTEAVLKSGGTDATLLF